MMTEKLEKKIEILNQGRIVLRSENIFVRQINIFYNKIKLLYEQLTNHYYSNKISKE